MNTKDTKLNNSYSQTTVRFVIFKEEKTWYGVALEFNIVKEGDHALDVMRELEEATITYFNTAKKNDLGLEALNQEVDPEYEKRWQSAQSRKLLSDIFTAGVLQPALVA
ncbi:hypothetical protein HY224_01705 [Candidatus Uhrbacteria bacterium]|nr:hypothetical protein [Candidatus Uhrbacteria bacterium]